MTFNSHNIRSILVFSNGELIGDGLVKLPFLTSLRSEFPHAKITWLTRNSCVYNTMIKDIAHQYLDSVIENTHLGSTWRHSLNHPWARQHYDLIINTEPRLWRMLAAKRISHQWFYSSYRHFLASDFKPIFPALDNPHHVLNQLMWHLSNIVHHPVTPPHPQIDIPETYLNWAKEQLPEGQKYIALAPGSGGRNKCWPLDKYIELALKLETSGMRPVFLIGPQELEWYEPIKAKLPNALFPLQNIDGSISVYHTMALSRYITLGVANDAGGSHLMATANIPLLVLYGPTTPTHFIPNTHHFYSLTIADCNVASIKDIPVKNVYDKILSMIHLSK